MKRNDVCFNIKYVCVLECLDLMLRRPKKLNDLFRKIICQYIATLSLSFMDFIYY